jgi:hypothetical protein
MIIKNGAKEDIRSKGSRALNPTRRHSGGTIFIRQMLPLGQALVVLGRSPLTAIFDSVEFIVQGLD